MGGRDVTAPCFQPEVLFLSGEKDLCDLHGASEHCSYISCRVEAWGWPVTWLYITIRCDATISSLVSIYSRAKSGPTYISRILLVLQRLPSCRSRRVEMLLLWVSSTSCLVSHHFLWPTSHPSMIFFTVTSRRSNFHDPITSDVTDLPSFMKCGTSIALTTEDPTLNSISDYCYKPTRVMHRIDVWTGELDAEKTESRPRVKQHDQRCYVTRHLYEEVLCYFTRRKTTPLMISSCTGAAGDSVSETEAHRSLEDHQEHTTKSRSCSLFGLKIRPK